MAKDLMSDMLPKVVEYIDGRDWSDVPVMQDRKFAVTPLSLDDDPCTHLTQGVKGDMPMACMFAVNIFPPPSLIAFKRRWIQSHRFPVWSYHGGFANGSIGIRPTVECKI